MENNTEKPEFWESNFVEKREMWGFEPAQSAVLTADFFAEKALKNILIPGIGYGRNASAFTEKGMTVTGIEISQTAIEMAETHFGSNLVIHHGSVSDMPFDTHTYDGIFCYSLIHLLDEDERKKLIADCYRQLEPNGYMVFIAISKKAHTYGTGKYLSKDRYELFGGVNMFFYDEASIQSEFSGSGLVSIQEIEENYPFYLITCQKTA